MQSIESEANLLAQKILDEDHTVENSSETHVMFIQRECIKLLKKRLQIAKLEQETSRELKRKKMYANRNGNGRGGKGAGAGGANSDNRTQSRSDRTLPESRANGPHIEN